MNSFFFGVLFALMFTFNLTTMARTTIVVKNQADFNDISVTLYDAVKNGDDDIYVLISSGQFTYSEQHIKLTGLKAPHKNIHIIGHKTSLVPEGKVYQDGDLYEGTFSYSSSWMCEGQDVDVWTSVHYADGLIEVINANTKECRLKSLEPLMSRQELVDAYILVTQWYLSRIYKIKKIKDNYIYFTADDLVSKADVIGGFSINNDYYYNRVNPRYKLCNVETNSDVVRITGGKVVLPHGIKHIREGVVDRLLHISNCSFNNLEIKGIEVLGNSNVKEAPALDLVNSMFRSARIHGCRFVGIRSNLMNISSCNVIVEDNVFSDCYLYCIQAGNRSVHTVIRNNKFVNMGKRMNNSFCVSCMGVDFVVSDNTFTDFGYGAVTCGVWYKSNKDYACTGVVKDNFISYSDIYLANVQNHTLMDGGAIYLATKMDGVKIKNNRINGFSGAGDNRGIFCDDGAYNFELSGNVISNIDNSYCIDSRRCAHVELQNTPTSGIERANVNVVIKDNVVDGNIRFAGHEDDNNGCVLGNNYALINPGERIPEISINNVSEEGIFIPLDKIGVKRGKIVLSRNSYKQLKKSAEWNRLKVFFVR